MPAGRGIPGLPRHHRIFVAPGRQTRAFRAAASTKADIGPPAVISSVGSPRWQDVDVPGRYRGDAMEHRINHSPVRGQRVVAGSISRATLSAPSAVQPSNPSAADY